MSTERKRTVPSIEQSLAIVRNVLAVVDEISPKTEMELDVLYAPVISLFWRCVRLQKAVLILLEAKFPDEAFALARSLFDDALLLEQLNQAKEHRAAMTYGWIRKSISEKEGLFREALRSRLSDDISAELETIVKEREQLELFAKARGVVKPRPFLVGRDAAFGFGRKEDYWSYCLAHELVHGSDAALALGRQKDDRGVFQYALHSDKPWIVATVAGFSARSLLQAATATASMLGWNCMERLVAVEKDINAFDF